MRTEGFGGWGFFLQQLNRIFWREKRRHSQTQNFTPPSPRFVLGDWRLEFLLLIFEKALVDASRRCCDWTVLELERRTQKSE
jgi:hypothetical protein